MCSSDLGRVEEKRRKGSGADKRTEEVSRAERGAERTNDRSHVDPREIIGLRR